MRSSDRGRHGSSVGVPALRTNDVTRNRTIFQFSATMALVALSLLPMLASGFYGDDEANSLVTGALLAMKSQTLFGLVMRDFVGWVTSVGRFFPLSEYVRILFWAVNGNPLTYKIILMALVLLDAALLYAFVGRLTKSPTLAAVAVLALSVTLQFRFYHEPTLSYAGLLPVITALVLAALFWFVGYLEAGKRSLLVASVAAFAASLLIYEVALLMCLVFVALAWLYPLRRSFMQAVRASWVHLAAAGTAVGIVLALRLVFHFQPSTAEQLSGYQLSLSPLPVATTLVKQIVAALPLSYYGSRMLAATLGMTYRALYDSPLMYLSTHPATTLLSAAAYLMVALYLLKTLLRGHPITSPPITRSLLATGLGFLVLPSVLISLAAKHQLGVNWGQGYLPVFMSAFGVALIATTAIDWARRSDLVKRKATPISIALALVLACGGAINFDNNRITVEGLNRSQPYIATVAAEALSSGLFAPVPDGAWVLSNVDSAWQVPDFYRLHAGKSLVGTKALINGSSIEGLRVLASSRPSAESTSYVIDPAGPPVYYLYVESSTRDAGYALLSRIESVTVTPGAISVSGTPLLAYRAWPKPGPYDWQQVKGWPNRPASYEPTSALGPALLAGRVVASGSDWVLQSAPEGWTVTQLGFDPGQGRSWLDFPGPVWSRTQ